MSPPKRIPADLSKSELQVTQNHKHERNQSGDSNFTHLTPNQTLLQPGKQGSSTIDQKTEFGEPSRQLMDRVTDMELGEGMYYR